MTGRDRLTVLYDQMYELFKECIEEDITLEDVKEVWEDTLLESTKIKEGL